MPDPVIQPPAPPPPPVAPPTPPPPPKLAGKYENSEALQKGARELFAKTGLLNLTETQKLVGDGGLYKDDAALETAYKNAERLIGKPREPEAIKSGEPGLPVSTEAPEALDDTVGVDGILKSVGLDGKGQELAEKFTKDGVLEEKDYKRFALKGYTKAQVNDYMRGQQAIAVLATQAQAAIRTQAIEIVGSEEQLKTLLDTAHEYVKDKAELKDIADRAKKPGSFKGALRDLMEHYSKHVGADGSKPLVNGQPSGPGGGPAKSLKEFGDLSRLAQQGDKVALERIRATPLKTINSWNH